MNVKKLLLVLFSCALLCGLALPSTFAETRGNIGSRGSIGSHPSVATARSPNVATTARSGTQWNRGDGRWHGRDGRFCHRNFVFFGGFGYPFGYPYFGYPYSYGYGYYPYAYYDAYYPSPYYSGPSVYQGREVPGYRSGSLVIHVQERLARAGYYHGAIDGVIGSGTRRAIRSYERAHGLPVDGRIDPSLLATMGLA